MHVTLPSTAGHTEGHSSPPCGPPAASAPALRGSSPPGVCPLPATRLPSLASRVAGPGSGRHELARVRSRSVNRLTGPRGVGSFADELCVVRAVFVVALWAALALSFPQKPPGLVLSGKPLSVPRHAVTLASTGHGSSVVAVPPGRPRPAPSCPVSGCRGRTQGR